MDGFLLIVGIYVVLTVVGALQKKQRLERERLQREAASLRPGARDAGVAAPAAQLTELERALEALRRAELEAKARAEAQRRLPLQGGMLSAPRLQAVPAEFEYDAEASEDAEDSEEEIFSVEAINLDEESEREAEGRQSALERYRAQPRAVEDVPAAPAIASRIQTAIVPTIPAAEADTTQPTVQPAARRTPLGRFASGRARDAVVLSEILARPVGERM